MQTEAFVIVMTMRISVSTAKMVSDVRTGLYCSAWLDWYIRTSLKMKYAEPARYNTMIMIIPGIFSRRVHQAAMKSMRMVTGTAAIVR